MPRCRNKEVRSRPDTEVSALVAYMNRRPVADFIDIRQNVTELSALSDAELKQVIQDAGLEHDDGP